MNPNSITDPDRSRLDLDEVVEEIATAISTGRAVDVDAYVEKYPQFREQLRNYALSMELLAAFGDTDSVGARESDSSDFVTPTNRVIGDFRIRRELGRGGMGIVYEAEQISLDRTVALKILPFAAILNDRQLQRFKNEARAAATLQHPHIVSIFSVGSERGVHYYAMQHIDGPSLADVLQDVRGKVDQGDSKPDSLLVANTGRASVGQESPSRSNRIAASETCRDLQAAISTQRASSRADYFRRVADWAKQAAEALAYAHENGVLHRDVKPGNLLLDRSGKLLVADFGLARLESEASMTVSGDILGTLRYMAPEQALAKRVLIDHRADIYSLGITLYELVTTKPAFSAEDREQLLHQVAFQDPMAPTKLDPRIPRNLETIIVKASAKTPGDRYASAEDLAHDLQCFLDNRPITARPQTVFDRIRSWSRRHRAVAASVVVAALLVGLASTSAFLWARQKNHQLAQAVSNAQAATRLADGKTRDTEAALARESVALAEVSAANHETQRALSEARQAQQIAERNLYLATMRQAHFDLLQGDSSRFADSVASYIALDGKRDLRGWEWYYLLTRYEQEQKVLYEHLNGVCDIAWHPQGEYLATAGVSGTDSLCLWDLPHASLKSVIRLHPTQCVAWHPGGKLLAIAFADMIRIWDVETGLFSREIATGAESEAIHTNRGRCRSLEFSPDGKKLAAAIPTVGCKLWETGEFTELWSHELTDAYSLSWSPSGSRIVCSGEESAHVALILDAKDGQVIDRFRGKGEMLIVRWSPRGDCIAACEYHKRIQVYDSQTFELRHEVEVNSTMEQIDWSHDGSYLAVGVGKNVDIYNNDLRLVDRMTGHTSSVLSVGWSADDKSLAAGAVGAARIWKFDRKTSSMGARTVAADISDEEAHKSFFSRTGRFVATLDRYGDEVTVRRLSDGVVVQRFCVDISGSSRKAVWSHDDRWIACGANKNRSIMLLNVANGESHVMHTLNDGELRDLDWHPTEMELAIAVATDGNLAGRLEVWDTGSRRMSSSSSFERAPIDRVAWDPAGVRLAIVEGRNRVAYDQIIRIFDLPSQTTIHTLTGHSRFGEKPAWSSGGNQLAAFGWDGKVTIWDTELGVIAQRLQGHGNAVRGVWHPSQKRLFTCSSDGTFRLWDTDSGFEILRVEADCQSMAISPKGGMLYLMGRSLDLIDISDALNSPPRSLTFHAIARSVERGDVESTETMISSLPSAAPDRQYLLRRMFHSHFWLATTSQGAFSQSSVTHLSEMLRIWHCLVENRATHTCEEYGRPPDEHFTYELLQAAFTAPRLAERIGEDIRPFLPLMEETARTVEARLAELDLKPEACKAFLSFIEQVDSERRRLAEELP